MRHFSSIFKPLDGKVEKERLKGLKEHFPFVLTSRKTSSNLLLRDPLYSSSRVAENPEEKKKLCCAKGNSHLCALHFRCKSTPPTLLTLFNHVPIHKMVKDRSGAAMASEVGHFLHFCTI